MYNVVVLHFSEETIHPEISIGSCQRTDDETRLFSFTLMVHTKTADLMIGKESSHCFFRRLLVRTSLFVQNNQIDFVAQILVKFLSAPFLESSNHSLRNILRHKRRDPDEETGQQKDYPFFHFHKYLEAAYISPPFHSYELSLLKFFPVSTSEK